MIGILMECLVADIGGTTARFAVANIKRNLITLSNVQSFPVSDVAGLVKSYLSKLPHLSSDACLAIAGPVRDGHSVMTNTDLVVDAKQLEQKTPLRRVHLVNDFVALGQGILSVSKRDIRSLTPKLPDSTKTCSVLGVGTGLGKCILTGGRVLPSEGGHAEFPCLNEEEWEIFGSVMYEDVLSGRGLEKLYQHFQKTQFPSHPTRLSAREIGESQSKNPCSRKAFRQFLMYLARAARNFALETYSLGGVFLAGGIVQKNSDLIGGVFVKEFCRHSVYGKLLRSIPISLVLDGEVSLRGAASIGRVFLPHSLP